MATLKVSRPLAQMRAIADALVAKLAPACTHVEVAGSIRRGKPMIGDIEIVCVPPMRVDLFGNETPDSAPLVHLLDSLPITVVKSGTKYWQFSFSIGLESVTVDLFLATPENFGYILMLRTGPWEFSKRMVTPREWGGLKPAHITVADGYVYEHGNPIAVPDEVVLFGLWEMAYIKPQERN